MGDVLPEYGRQRAGANCVRRELLTLAEERMTIASLVSVLDPPCAASSRARNGLPSHRAIDLVTLSSWSWKMPTWSRIA